MKRMIIIAALASLPLISVAEAHPKHEHRKHHRDHHDYARVIDVEPIYAKRRHRRDDRECWNEEISYTRHGSSGVDGMLAGGIIGGVIGNHIGKGDGRDAAIVAGTLLGSAVGYDLARSDDSRSHVRTRISSGGHCDDHRYERHRKHIKGYRVTYRYRGDIYHTRLSYHPGKRLRVKVDVRPVHR